MALIPCAHCGKPISQHARACPACLTPTGNASSASAPAISVPPPLSLTATSTPVPLNILRRPPLTKIQIATQVVLLVTALLFAIIAFGNYSIADQKGTSSYLSTLGETGDYDAASVSDRQTAEQWRSAGRLFGFASAGIVLLLVGFWTIRSLSTKKTCPACLSRLHPQATICKFCRTALPQIES